MEKRRQKLINVLAITILAYVSLVLILYICESRMPGATIRTLGDAFWYSIVTLTTVGYGDITPVTAGGRLVGLIFLILATGTLVALLGAAFSFLTGEAFPFLKLRLMRSRDWYYFADCGVESQTLAANIIKEDGNAVIIFGERQDEHQEDPEFPCLFLSASPARIVRLKGGKGNRMKFFLMRENDISSNTRAANLHSLPVDVYANTSNGEDTLSGNIHFFHAYDCCAREYWRSNPMTKSDQVIVLIGFGHYGRSILERAIQTNIISDRQHVAYHVFGNADLFRQLHPNLGKVFSMGEESEERDSIIYHEDAWSCHHDLIARADRIIIAEDDVVTGWNIFWRIRKYYRYKCKIDLRNNRISPGVSYFGTYEDTFTPEHIMRTSLNRAAIAMNRQFRESVSYPTLDWEELDDFHRQSKIAAADHVLQKVRILLRDESLTQLSAATLHNAYERYLEESKDPERLEVLGRIEYLRWIRFYIYFNWEYGEARDDAARKHPMLCGYENLTSEQKMERNAAWELLGSLAREFE